MKLTKNKTTGYYYAQFTVNGKRKRISTRTKTLKEAQAYVKESGVDQLEKAAKVTTLTHQMIGQLTAGKRLSNNTALRGYKKWIFAVRAAKTATNNTEMVSAFLNATNLETLPPAAITTEHISQWVNREGPAKLNTRRVNLAAIRTYLSYCMSKGYIPHDPSTLGPKLINRNALTHKQKEVEKPEIWEKVEVRRLLNYCSDNGLTFWYLATYLAFELGLRLGDVCNLEWACFNESGYITVHTRKRAKRVKIPLPNHVQQLLPLIPPKDNTYCFPLQRALINNMKKRAQVSLQFARLCARAGVPQKTFHALRHTRISIWKKEGRSLEDIGKLVGHSLPETTAGYVSDTPPKEWEPEAAL